ncbi:MAG TPA: protein phosphatase [Dermatophilaceae bacterium]|nr:protein phosphatase [Dermatophilaceae bacterium]
MSTWGAGPPGILSLPSGRLVRGRGLRRPLPDDALPQFGVYLLNKRPEPVTWEARWVRWQTSGCPRTAPMPRTRWARPGAALACLGVLDGLPPREAVAYVQEHYGPTGR